MRWKLTVTFEADDQTDASTKLQDVIMFMLVNDVNEFEGVRLEWTTAPGTEDDRGGYPGGE